MIQRVAGGYVVVSEKGKRLSRVYRSRKGAERRLKQIEWFKHKERANA